VLGNLRNAFKKLADYRYLGAVEKLELKVVEKELRKITQLDATVLTTGLGLPADKVTNELVEK
jgi:hypothetical protein